MCEEKACGEKHKFVAVRLAMDNASLLPFLSNGNIEYACGQYRRTRWTGLYKTHSVDEDLNVGKTSSFFAKLILVLCHCLAPLLAPRGWH